MFRSLLIFDNASNDKINYFYLHHFTFLHAYIYNEFIEVNLLVQRVHVCVLYFYTPINNT